MSWRATINNQRWSITKPLGEDSSLRLLVPEFVVDTDPGAVALAVAETTVDDDTCPDRCPWCPEQLLDEYWLSL
jgi:hypothetical protein